MDPSPCPLPETERGKAMSVDGEHRPQVPADPLTASGRGQGEG
jgi:hypothetical protein